jgi:PAS domain S-box-containing protein
VTVVPVGLASHAAVTKVFATKSRLVVRWTRAVEAVLLTGAITLVSATVFTPMPQHRIAQVILLFAPVPLVLYAALRFGLAGAALALFITACGAMRGAMHDATLIRTSTIGAGVVVQQLLFLAVAIPLLFLAAVIDERRRALVELTAREARYSLATEAGRVFVYAYDPESGAVETDAALGAMLHVPPTELRSPAWWWRQIHPEDASKLQRAWNARLDGTSLGSPTATLDFRLVDRDGRVRWFRPLRARRSGARGLAVLVGTVTDITELREAEQVAASRELATSRAPPWSASLPPPWRTRSDNR